MGAAAPVLADNELAIHGTKPRLDRRPGTRGLHPHAQQGHHGFVRTGRGGDKGRFRAVASEATGSARTRFQRNVGVVACLRIRQLNVGSAETVIGDDPIAKITRLRAAAARELDHVRRTVGLANATTCRAGRAPSY
jgi:hypothetical protein